MTGRASDAVRDRLRTVLADIADVRLAFLYGSRARGRARADSDFDVGVLLDAESARVDRGTTLRRLSARLGQAISSTLVDLVILNDAPALLRHRILRDGLVIFERAPGERVRFAIRTLREYQDGQVRREAFTRERVRRVKATINNGGSGDLLEKARGVARLLAKAPGVP